MTTNGATRSARQDEYLCTGCGYRSKKWLGFCPQCRSTAALSPASAAGSAPTPITEVARRDRDRRSTGIAEVDRVLGGGLVAGVAVLCGGEPGVGKSTLLLQVAAEVARRQGRVLYATAEESLVQVALRARRTGADVARLEVVAESDVDAILGVASQLDLALLVVDSIQTVATPTVEGTPGGVSQVRESAARLLGFAKARGVPVVIVGHVTKDGSLAGPKLLEHMVDVVLYLEGERDHGLRIVRGLKNRYGSVNEIGLFEMGDRGMRPLEDPAGALIGHRSSAVPGTVLFPAVEGRRPLVVEVQALVARSGPQPRRSVKGVDAARVHQILAVLDRHGGIELSGYDVYVSVAGGVRIREPAVDLPIALSLASSFSGIPVGGVAAWGEIGLTGEVRPVTQGERRRNEGLRIGASAVVAPAAEPMLLADALRAAGLLPVG